MAVYHDSVGVTKKKKKTTEGKSQVAQDYEAKKKKEEEEKKQREAQQKANQRRASLPTVLAKNENSGASERYLRQNGGQYGKDLANARSVIPGAAKTTLANEQIMREQSKRPNALERNPYVQTAVAGSAAIRNQTAPDAATAQYTYEDYTKAMRELERQRAQDRLQEAKRRENNVYRYAKDYSADELSLMQQAAQMGAEYEAERAARSARDPRLTGGNVYQQQNADRTMNEAYRRAEEAEGRAAYLQAAKKYREDAERDAVMQGRYDRLPSDPSFRNQAALGKQRYERTTIDREAFDGDPNEKLSKRPADMLVGEKKEIFYALYAQDPQKAQEYAEYTFWKDYQAEMDKAFAWAGQNPLTRGTSWELGRRLGQAAGFQPFTTTGRMMAMMGQALSGGSAQGLQEHGLLNMGDTGKAAQLSSDPYVRALGRRFSAQSLAGTLPENIEVIGGDGPVAQGINKSISALVGGKGLADVSQLASSMLTSYENAMLTGAFGMLGEGMDPAQAENVAKVGEAIGLALMGSSAAASDYAELMAKGVDQKTAMLHATAAGVAEAAFEKLSLENIIHMRTDGGLKQLLENWFIQAGVEASEETFTTMANRVTDEIIMDTNGYYSAVQERQHELLVQGVPYAEAKAQAEREWLVEILNDALGGFISGGGMTAMNTVQGGIANIQERIEARNERNTMREWIGSAAANEQNAELQAALDQYAKDNKLKGYDQAQIEQVREWNRQQSQQATEEAQSTTKSEREVRRETARGKKAARNVGKVTQAVLNDIEQKTRGKVMREYEADLADVSSRYKGLADTVRETAYNASSDLYGTAKSVRELDTLHKDNVQGVKNDALRQAAISAYNDRMEQLAPKGSRADARWRARQAFSNGALDLSASYGEGEGRVQTQIDGITEDGKKIKLANGEVKAVDELELDTDTQDILKMLTTRGLGSVANDVLAEYQAQVKKGDLMSGYGFATDFIRAIEYGRTNQKLSDVQDALKNIKDSRTVEVAWKLGREQAQKQAEAGRRSTAAKAQTGRKASYQTVEELLGKEPDGGGVKSATGRKGSVDVSRIKGMQLDAAQTSQVQMAKTIARALGVDVSFFASEADENGRYHGAQGSYRDGVIELDINAGRLSTLAMKSGILKTMSHELTHFIQDYSSDLYQELKDFAFQVLGEKAGVGGIEELIDEKVARSGDKISRPDAEDEVIADAMETMLGSSEAVKQLYAQNATLADKVLSWLADFMSVVKAAIGPADHREAKIIDELDEQMRKVFQDKWDAALADAANRLAGNVSSERVNDATEAIGITVDTQTESANPTDMQFSERTWTASDYVQHMDAAAAKLAEALDLPKEKAEKYIRDINSVAKMIADDRARLDYYSAPGLSAFKSNSEYGGSIDFSTLCKKRRLFTGTFSAIQRALPNTTLTAQDVLAIRSMMDEAGLEVACGKCYVEGSRAVMGEFTRRFIDQYKQLNPGKWAPNMAQMNTPDGIEWVRQTHPEVYEQYEYFWNHYGKLEGIEGKNLFASQQKPKLYQARTEYKGEVLEEFQKSTKAETQAVVKEKNDNGGLRMQSFSDFELVHLIDCMQVIMDMSRVGLYGQAYTKVPEFAMALGKTGLKINLSIDAWGVDENGKLIFNDKEGMNSQTAFDLRNRFSDNVGTICCVYDDKMLLAALADERIDFIIPFHRSQWKKSQYKAMGLPDTTKDYTYQQNEKWLNPKAHTHEYRGRTVPTKVTNYMPNEYWYSYLSGKENAERYLEKCAKDGKRPKFYKLLVNNGDGSYSLQPDGSTDGYWKLLIDFKMYNNEGVGVPQQAVKPIFDMDGEGGIKQMLAEYKDGHNRYPVAQGIVDDFVEKYKKEHPKKQYSERDTEYLSLAKDPEKNRARLQEMVDEAAEKAGYDTGYLVWRGDSKPYNVLKTGAELDEESGNDYTDDHGNLGNGLYFTPDRSYAERFAGRNGVLRKFYLKSNMADLENADVRAIRMAIKQELEDELGDFSRDELYERLMDETETDGIKAKGVGGFSLGAATDVLVRESWQAKLADPVTYDDSGNVIPLSERFDTRKEDIRYSLRPVEAVEPKTNGWQRSATFDEVKAEHPTLFELAAEEADTRNPTQIKGTVRTYRKIYDKLKAEGFDGTILDASSGLGVGTEAGRNEYNFDVDDIEPFPDASYKPRYTDYSKLDKTYDVVISNAVLNVIPQDLRDAMVVKIGELLNPGGRAFINVRGDDVKNAKTKVAINEAGMEYFISDSGSYQKGFTPTELKAYLEDALGDGFTVQLDRSFGKVSAVVTKLGEKNTTREGGKVRYSERDESLLDDRELAQGLTEKDAQNEEQRRLLRDVKAKDAKIKALEEKLADARRELKTTERRLNTKGIPTFVQDTMRQMGITDANHRNLAKRVTGILTDTYEKALADIDNGKGAGEMLNTLYDGASQAVDAMIRDGTYTEQYGYGWLKQTWEQMTAGDAEGRQNLVDELVGYIYQDFAANRYREAIKPTAADRLVEKTAKQYQEKLDKATAHTDALTQQRDVAQKELALYKRLEQDAMGRAKGLEEDLAEARASLKAEQKDSKAADAKIQRLEASLKDARSKAKQWQSKAEHGGVLARQMAQSKNRDIRDIRAASDKALAGKTRELEKVQRDLEKQIQREKDILSGKLRAPQMVQMLKQERARVTEQKNEQIQKMRESRKRNDLMRRIRNLREDLQRRILRPTDRTFVPPELAKSLVAVLDTLDVSPKEGTKAAAKYERINDAVRKAADAYAALKNSEDSTFSTEYDAEFAEEVHELAARLDGRKVQDLTAAEMQEIYDTVRRIRDQLRYAAVLLNGDRTRSVYEAAESIREQQAKLTPRSQASAFERSKRNRLMGNLSVMRSIEMMSGWDRSSTLYQMYHDIENGASGSDGWVMRYNKRLQPLKTGKNEKAYRDALTRKVDFGIKDVDGRTVKMTRMQAIQLWLTYEREAQNDMLNHLQKGGAVIRDALALQDGKTDNITSQRVKLTNEQMHEIRNKLMQWNRQWVTDYEKTLRDYFAEEQTEANKVHNALKHTVIGSEAAYFPIKVDNNYLEAKLEDNEVFNLFVKTPGATNELKKSAPQPVIIDGADTMLARHVKEMGDYINLALPLRDFAKVYNARMQNGDDVYSTVQKMIEDNFGSKGLNLIIQSLKDVQGGGRVTNWNTQIADMLRSLQGSFVRSALLINPSVTIKQAASYIAANSVLSHKALEAGNRPIFTGADQSNSPTLIAHIFANPSGKTASRIYNEIDAHTSVHYVRRLGMSQTEIASEANRSGRVRRAMDNIGASMEQTGIGHAVRKAGEVLNPVTWIQRMDVATTAALWVAAKAQARYDGFKTGTTEYWDHVTELYEQTIRETQPMYDGLHRAAIQKGEGLMQYLFPFRTVPIQNHGQISSHYEAMLAAKGKQAKAAAAGKLARTVWANTMSAVVFSMFTMVAALMKRKTKKYQDEDEEYTTESVLTGLAQDVGSVWVSNLLPQFGSELVGIGETLYNKFTGSGKRTFDAVSVGIADLINDAVKTLAEFAGETGKALRGEDAELWDKTLTLLQDSAKLLGLPAETIVTYFNGMRDNIMDIVEGRSPVFNNDSVDRTNAVNAKRYYEAMLDGDEEKAAAVLDEMRANTTGTQKEINQKVRNAINDLAKEDYKSGEMDLDEYISFLESTGLWESDALAEKAVGAVKELYNDGKLTEDEAIDLLGKYKGLDEDEAWFKVQEWEDKAQAVQDALDAGLEADQAEDVSTSKYRRVFDAIDANADASEAIQDLIDHGMDKDAVTKKVKEYLRDQYVDGVYTEQKYKNYLSRYAGITGQDANDALADAKNRVRAKEFEQKHPELDWTMDNITAYYDKVPKTVISKTPAQANIPVSTFDLYLTNAKTVTGTDKDHDGKTDSGSLKQAYIYMVDKLPGLSNEQKELLLRLKYDLPTKSNEDKEYDIPWHKK